MSTGSAQLAEIYAPIREEFEQLGRFLECEFSSSEPYIYEILQHIARFRGKQIRPALLFLTNRFAGGLPSAGLVKIGAVLEMIHTATLVHDDLLDDAQMRRMLDTVHTRWGDRAAILMGDYIYSRAFQLSTEVAGMASVLSKTTHVICEGELLQIGHRFVPDLSEEVYYEIIRKKTGILHAIACRLGGVFAGLDEESCDRLENFGMDLGIAFQIVDDYLDYAGKEEVVGKSLGTDLHQGKVTLPLIYLRDILTGSDRDLFREALGGRPTPEAERRIHDLVIERGVLDDVYTCAAGFTERAKSALGEIAINGTRVGRELRDCLELTTEYVLKRQR